MMNDRATLLVIISIPMVIQGAALAVDEFVFHRRRGLPRWECVGHPLDTLSVLIVALLACFLPLSEYSFFGYLAAVLFSCFFVTKDEWIHSRLCEAREQWLHSVLFVCHPLVFVSTAVLWCWRDTPHIFALDVDMVPAVSSALLGQVSLLTVFLAYQIIYWNFVRRPISD